MYRHLALFVCGCIRHKRYKKKIYSAYCVFKKLTTNAIQDENNSKIVYLVYELMKSYINDITFCILCPKQFILISPVTTLDARFQTGQIFVV